MKSEKLKAKSEKPTSMRIRFVLYILLFTIHYSLFTIFPVFAAESSTVEDKLTNFIRQFYNEREDVYVKFSNLPDILKEKIRVRHINFVKIPDSNGNGLCLVEIDGKNSRTKNVYVSFKALNKKRLFALKQNGKRGDIIHSGDILVKDAFMADNGTTYPVRIEDVVGKALKKDVTADIAITSQVLEDYFIVQRGETVNIVAENKKLLIQAKGRTLEKGRMGDVIRVKNLTSDREIVGRVAGSGIIKVDL